MFGTAYSVFCFTASLWETMLDGVQQFIRVFIDNVKYRVQRMRDTGEIQVVVDDTNEKVQDPKKILTKIIDEHDLDIEVGRKGVKRLGREVLIGITGSPRRNGGYFNMLQLFECKIREFED